MQPFSFLTVFFSTVTLLFLFEMSIFLGMISCNLLLMFRSPVQDIFSQWAYCLAQFLSLVFAMFLSSTELRLTGYRWRVSQNFAQTLTHLKTHQLVELYQDFSASFSATHRTTVHSGGRKIHGFSLSPTFFDNSRRVPRLQ